MVRWLAITALVPGCSGLVSETEDGEPACDLSFDTLEDRTFVMLETREVPDASGKVTKVDSKNPIARLRFEAGDDGLVAKYTVASLSDVYDMPCELREKDESATLVCSEEPRPQDWCQALLVADLDGVSSSGRSCSKKTLKRFGATQSDEDLNEAIKAAKDVVKKYRGTEFWPRFALNNNNLANKLQGRLYVDINEKRCRLSVGDYYWTIFNGSGQEDTNPVGQNPFVEETEQEYLFDHCVQGNIMPGFEKDEIPADLSTIPPRRAYINDRQYFFYYLGEKNVEAEQDCSYSYDVWSNWKPISSGNTAQVADGKVQWKFPHTFTDAVSMMNNPKPLAVVTMVRHKECAGKKEQLDVVCEAGLLQYED